MRASLVAILIAFSIPAKAADVQVRAERQDDSFEIEASAQFVADLRIAWDVLTDYEHLSDFIPGMHSSQVIARNGGEATVDQRGEARMLFFSFPIEVRLAITETPHERIESHAISGNFKDLRGTYQLESRGGQLHLHYSGRFTPDFDIPPLIGTMLVRHTLEQRFGAMVDEIVKRQRASDRQNAPESRS